MRLLEVIPDIMSSSQGIDFIILLYYCKSLYHVKIA